MLWKLWRKCWFYIIRTWYLVRLDDGDGLLLSSFSLSEVRDLGLVEQALDATKYLSPLRMQAHGWSFTLREFLAADHELADLVNLFDAAELQREGFSAWQLRRAGVTADKLKICYDIHQLRDAGFTASELRLAGFPAVTICNYKWVVRFTAAELREARFDTADMMAAAWPAQELIEAGWMVADLLKFYSVRQLRKTGVTAPQLQLIGCEAGQLLAGGYPIIQIWMAGYTISQMREAGVTARQLVDAINASKYALLLGGFATSEIPSPREGLDNRGM